MKKTIIFVACLALTASKVTAKSPSGREIVNVAAIKSYTNIEEEQIKRFFSSISSPKDRERAVENSTFGSLTVEQLTALHEYAVEYGLVDANISSPPLSEGELNIVAEAVMSFFVSVNLIKEEHIKNTVVTLTQANPEFCEATGLNEPGLVDGIWGNLNIFVKNKKIGTPYYKTMKTPAFAEN